MVADILQNATMYGLTGFGNTLCNGFSSDFSLKEKTHQVGIKLEHFNPMNHWSIDDWDIVDRSTGEKYCNDSTATVRMKCAALFAATLFVQPLGLTLNLLNRIGKVVTFAHLWNPSQQKYDFKARLAEWGMDLLRIVTTPLIWVGMLFASLYGAIVSPYDGRKLYATLERFAYSGGYQYFAGNHYKQPHDHLIAPCFQPEPKAHIGGGKIGEKDVW